MSTPSEIFSKPILVVLGASLDQLFLIQTAQDMGFAVLALDMNPDAGAKDDADMFEAISTKDVDAVCAHLDGLKAQGADIAGVTTMGSDIPDVVVAIAQHVGTPSISAETAAIATDKIRMKKCFADHGVPIPWYAEIGSFDELKEIISERGYSLVIKPNDRSGSRGVFLLDESQDVEDLFNKARDFSFTGRVLVEEFLQGLQLSTETMMIDGIGYTPGFADRNYDDTLDMLPQIMENGGWVPTALSDEQVQDVHNLLVSAALAMGITDGVAKGDAVLTPEGPKMIEMAARLSGGHFSAGLVPISIGVNYVKTVIELATGMTPDVSELSPKWVKSVANRYFFPEAGRLVRIEGSEEVSSWDWVEMLEFWYEPGDEVPPMLSHAHRFGAFMVSAPDRKTLDERIAQVYDTINIVIEPM